MVANASFRIYVKTPLTVLLGQRKSILFIQFIIVEV